MGILFKIEKLLVEASGKTILDSLSLDLPANQIIGLLGKNGSGKTTLLKALAGHMSTKSGQIMFGGSFLSKWKHQDLARKLAYLPQKLPPAQGLLVKELVALGRYPWHGALGSPTSRDHEAVDRALVSCGMSEIKNQRVDTLSGGEAQRAWLAMLVAQEAGCLLLDEPISALDISHQVEVLNLIKDLCNNNGCSIIVVFHDLNMAARYCNHIVALSDGNISFQGETREFMKAQQLRKTYGTNMELIERSDGSLIAVPE